jgi:recombination protein RecR
MSSSLLTELIESLQVLPGVGPKSAQRIAFHLMSQNRDIAKGLSSILERAAHEIGRCNLCRNFSELTVCKTCSDLTRDASTICVVENPLDVLSIEQGSGYRGIYFVLLGRLSPIDGVSAEVLGIPRLEAQLEKGGIKEVIIATGTTMEGEATAHYIGEIAHQLDIRASRIAYGVPVGGDLEFVDSSTLSRALASRQLF